MNLELTRAHDPSTGHLDRHSRGDLSLVGTCYGHLTRNDPSDHLSKANPR